MNNLKNNKGFTLAELLIAMALGLFLTAVVVTVYISSKATFRATEAVARAQENTRFAVEFLVKDIRQAGFSVCSDGVSQRNFLDTTSPAYAPAVANAVSGWEFSGTDAGETYDLTYKKILSLNSADDATIAAARSSNAGAASDWDGDLPDVLASFGPLAGSDVVVVSISEPQPVTVDTSFLRRNPQLDLVDLDENPAPSNIEQGQIIKVGDCAALDLFQNEARNTDTFLSANVVGGSTLMPGNDINASFQWQKNWNASSSIYTMETRVFYVGTGAGGSPSLFMFSSDCGLDIDCPGATNSELVEGVESLQVLYGNDSNDDGVANRFVSANAITDFADVSTVKLGLLMRSTNNGRDTVDTDTFTLLGNIVINPPDDSLLRYVSNTTIKLYNKGL